MVCHFERSQLADTDVHARNCSIQECCLLSVDFTFLRIHHMFSGVFLCLSLNNPSNFWSRKEPLMRVQIRCKPSSSWPTDCHAV